MHLKCFNNIHTLSPSPFSFPLPTGSPSQQSPFYIHVIHFLGIYFAYETEHVIFTEYLLWENVLTFIKDKIKGKTLSYKVPTAEIILSDVDCRTDYKKCQETKEIKCYTE
jgi:hypothetical protein